MLFGWRFPGLPALMVLISTLCLAGSGQSPQNKTAAHQIQVRTGEVVVDVNVTDSGGKPVRGLTESDFEVYEDGVRQQVVSFRAISGGAVQENAAQAPIRNTIVQSTELTAASPAYPNLISLVFDKVNAEPGDAARAATAARAYVEKLMREGDQAAVFGIGFGIHVFQRFTSDRASLVKAVLEAIHGSGKYPGDVSAELRTALQNIPTGGSFIPGVDTDEDKINLAYSADADMLFKLPILQEVRVLLFMQRIDQFMRGNRSMAGLLAIIEAQRVIPGRKSMIFLSIGFVVACSNVFYGV